MIAGDWQRRPDKELLCQILQQELAEHRHHSIRFHNQVLLTHRALNPSSFEREKKLLSQLFPFVNSIHCQIDTFSMFWKQIILALSNFQQWGEQWTQPSSLFRLSRRGQVRFIPYSVDLDQDRLSFFNSTSPLLRMDILCHSMSELHVKSTLTICDPSL